MYWKRAVFNLVGDENAHVLQARNVIGGADS